MCRALPRPRRHGPVQPAVDAQRGAGLAAFELAPQITQCGPPLGEDVVAVDGLQVHLARQHEGVVGQLGINLDHVGQHVAHHVLHELGVAVGTVDHEELTSSLISGLQKHVEVDEPEEVDELTELDALSAGLSSEAAGVAQAVAAEGGDEPQVIVEVETAAEETPPADAAPGEDETSQI